MSGGDWRQHSTSVGTYDRTLTSPASQPVGGGVNSLQHYHPPGPGYQRRGYVNDFVGTIRGSHEVSAAIRLNNLAVGCRFGLFAMFDDEDLGDTAGAYVCYLLGKAGALQNVYVAKGPGIGGEILAGPGADLAANHWWQLLFRLAFDQLGNLLLQVGVSDAQADSVASPVYTKHLPDIVIPSATAIKRGKFGFFFDGVEDQWTGQIDHISVSTTLTDL